VEASIQRGLRTPKGSRDSSTGRSCWTESRATGLSYGIPRSRGEPGYGGGAADRTGSKRRSAGQRRDRSGALIFQRWPGNGKSLEGSERPFRAAGSSRGELAGGLRSAEPSFYKRSGGEQRRLRPVTSIAAFMPCMPAGVRLFGESLRWSAVLRPNTS